MNMQNIHEQDACSGGAFINQQVSFEKDKHKNSEIETAECKNKRQRSSSAYRLSNCDDLLFTDLFKVARLDFFGGIPPTFELQLRRHE